MNITDDRKHHALGILPSGKIQFFPGNEVGDNTLPLTRIGKLFLKNHPCQGLFALAILKSDFSLTASFQFWREFACEYMTRRCQKSAEDVMADIAPLGESEAENMLNSAPPMQGAEYLSILNMQQIWTMLDDWLRHEVSEKFENFAVFLEQRAPEWHQLGRVCFHLAENKNDPDFPFAFMVTYSPHYGRGKDRHVPLAKALEQYAGNKNRQQLIHLLSPINIAAEYSKLVKALVHSGDIYHPLAWSAQQAYRFLQETSLFHESGIIVRLPNWWKRRANPKVRATLKSELKNTLGRDQLLRFNVRAVLGEHELSESEWKNLLALEDGLQFFKGQWIEVDKEKLVDAMNKMASLEKQAETNGFSLIEGIRLLAGASTDLSIDEHNDSEKWAFIEADKSLKKILQDIRKPQNLKCVPSGQTLKAELRPYQKIGVGWLWHLNQLGLGACLADDMGLGKTIQILSLLLIIKQHKVRKPSLLVLPTSLLGNWKNELQMFAPSLNALFAHPSMTKKSKLDTILNTGGIGSFDIVITTYGMLLRQPWLHDQQWHTVVLDEAQAIKNASAQQTRSAKKLNAQVRIVLTGTPVENRLSDLWSLFDFVSPGLLGTFSRFKAFAKSLEQRKCKQYAPLRNLVQPYILRRLKTDKNIISDLPDKTEVYAYCGLSKEQLALYQKSVNQLSNVLETEEGIKRRGLILAYIMRFKQICNHPSQYLNHDEYQSKHSGKFLRLAEICEQISSCQGKVLVFTQFSSLCQPLADFLRNLFGRSGLVLHGGVSAKKRQAIVQQFQREEGPPFMVLSIKAGGVGLNLTAASHVIHFDRWWNPAVENQATDRAFRIGQKKNVLVHKFVCQGTIEEKIDVIIAEKSALADDLLKGSSEMLLTEMSDRELINLVSLDIDKAQTSTREKY